MSARLPSVYLPHGGGPWPFVDLGLLKDELAGLTSYLEAFGGIAATAMLVISAHWEADAPTLQAAEHPPLLYDYYGFPPDAYRLSWPAAGSPTLVARVQALLSEAGFPSALDQTRGYDHGTFIPLMVARPNADIPTVQLPLLTGLDPKRHIELGRALRPLRDEGVLVVGSGMSFHNMRAFGRASGRASSDVFDEWLQETVALPATERGLRLAHWTRAPQARAVHPREEHLLPLMVAAGAAGEDRGTVPYSGRFMGCRISAVHFGG